MFTRGRVVIGSAMALAMAATLMGGCSKSSEADRSAMADAPSYESAKAMGGSLPADAAPMHTAARQTGGQRSVVRQGSLDVDVENIDKAEKQMKDIVASHSGYIDHEEGSGLAGETPVLHLTIRVPEKSFEDTLTMFEGLGHRNDKTISASDLTEQILDLEAQVQQKKNGATGVPFTDEDLRRLRGEQDALAAKAAMSTIDLTLHQKPNAGLATAANASWGSDTWNAAMTSAMGAFRVIGAIAIWLLAFSPIWGLALFGPIFGYRLWKRHSVRA